MSNQSRNASIDNIKAVLIFLVVFGHLIETQILENRFLHAVWIFLYSFHMPMFALISGMFSKASLDERQSGQLLKNIVVPLVTFELFYEGLQILLKGKASIYTGLVAPYWMLWYLLSLLSWRLLLPVFSRLQFPVVAALALSLAAGYSEHVGYTFSLSRTLVFFPYFLLGWSMQPGFLAKLPRKLSLVSLAILGLALIASFLLKPDFDYRWLYGSFSLRRLEMATMTGSLYQLLQYAVCTVVGLSFMHVMMQRDFGLAKVGQRSMYVFLWHALPLVILQETGLEQWLFGLEDLPMVLLSIGISVMIVWLASRSWCEQFTQAVMLRPFNWLLVRTLPQGAAAAAGAKQSL
jgi:fucose 4-O-acetylase-like acetyltransferase